MIKYFMRFMLKVFKGKFLNIKNLLGIILFIKYFSEFFIVFFKVVYKKIRFMYYFLKNN